MTNTLLSALADRRAFIVYRLTPKADGKLDKVPTNPLTGANIDAHDQARWLSPADAEAYAGALNLMPLPPDVLGYGVGIVISEGCGLFCIDLDDCRDGAGWQPHAHVFVARFPGAFVETSVSGTGVHIFGTYSGPAPAHGTRNREYRMEAYTRARFIAVTGNGSGEIRTDCTQQLHVFLGEFFPARDGRDSAEWRDTPVAEWRGPEDDDELLGRGLRMTSLRKAFTGGAQFRDLHTDGPRTVSQHYGGDDSAADQAYFNGLAFLTGKNCERMLRIAQRPDCTLNRDKWAREDYLRGTILRACADTTEVYRERGTVATPPAPTETDPRAVIQLAGGQLNRYAIEAEKLIAGSLYVHGDGLVRIGRAAEVTGSKIVQHADGSQRAQDAAGTERPLDQAVAVPATSAWLRRELMERAQFWKFDKRSGEWEPRDCPKELADNIAEQRSWASFRQLIAISAVPVLRPDLSVWLQPGYDAVTRVFYQPTMAIPRILDAPTRDDALMALSRLREPFAEFPFASPVSESVFLSHVITAVIRASFDTSPVFVYTAPIAASGKTLLASMPQLIATGSAPANSPYSEREELRKVLFASLLAGDASLILDNIGSGAKVRSAELCAFATSSSYADRVLGVSKRREMPNRCTVTLTGNNITPTGDLARRTLVCRLDVGAETARGRTFRIPNLKVYARDSRGQLIVDVLTIVRGYAFAGRPHVAHPLESFEEWSRLARDPLVWLGLPDPVASQETETDEEVSPLRGAFGAIATATYAQEYRFTTAQLSELMVPTVPTTGGGLQAASALRDAVLAAGCKKPESLQYWLREHRDRVAGGWKLAGKLDKDSGVMTWQLQAVG